MDFFLDVLAQGLAYGILALGVLLTYQVLDYADLTVEGSFPLGAAAGAVCITNGWNPFASLIVAFIAGLFAGYATGFLHVKFKISSLLAGILVMTALYSINLIVAGNSSLIALFTYDTMFTYGDGISSAIGLSGEGAALFIKLWPVLILLVLALGLKYALDWFLSTKYGFLIRIAGDNPQLIAALGKDIGWIKMNGLAISNGYAALSGAVVAQFLRSFDAQMGAGMIVLGLASVIMGVTLFKRFKFIQFTTSVILGAITYRLAIAIALSPRIGLPPTYLRLVMAIIFIIVLVLGNGVMGKFFHRAIKD